METKIEKGKLIEEIHILIEQVFPVIGQYQPEAWMDLDITIDQLKSLFFIDFKSKTNFKNLAAALGVTPPNITGIVDRLVAKGLVSREENPEDRRMMLLKTTDKGKTLLTRLKETGRNQSSPLLNQLSLEELKALTRGFRAIVRVLIDSREEKP